MTVKKQNGVFVFVFLLAWPSQYVFLLPHIPLIGQGGSIILVLYSMNVHWPTILYFCGSCEVQSHSYLQTVSLFTVFCLLERNTFLAEPTVPRSVFELHVSYF